jgi:hypothetical protein
MRTGYAAQRHHTAARSSQVWRPSNVSAHAVSTARAVRSSSSNVGIRCGAAPSMLVVPQSRSPSRYERGVSLRRTARPHVRAYLATAGLRRLPLGICGSNSTLVTYTHLGHS